MIDGMRVLWTTNVFSRIEQLRQQQFMIRQKFGKDITLMTFCNNKNVDSGLLVGQDILVRTDKNLGHHNGVRDAHNHNLPYLKDFDVVISSHADCFFQNWETPLEIIREMKKRGAEFAAIQVTRSGNPHTMKEGPYIYNDFFVMDARAWERMGEITHCEHNEGIEPTLGRWVFKVVPEEKIYVVPARYVHAEGVYMFADVIRPGNQMLRENDIGHKIAWLARNQPDTVQLLGNAGLVGKISDVGQDKAD